MYNKGMYLLATAELDLSAADLRVLLIGGDSTAGSQRDAATLDDFTLLDEINADNYTRKALSNLDVQQDDLGNKVVFDADGVSWTNLGGVQNDTIEGAIVYLHVNDDTDSVPIFYSGLDPLTTNGSDVVLNVNAAGVMVLANKASS